ncbi:aspartate/glutamate racemase family protein [Pseudolysinimonas sp.]|jgi:aspartate racemase|uniref:aspartate/glutamate racemase family protein n=1 Tax=Pseudolysinimonas sp. TaxID=2680009 RepID=UPI003783D3D4
MNRLGLLGGMSWESTALYYRAINEGVAERLGGYHSADLLMASVDFAEIERMQAADDWAGATTLLGARARSLADAGADLLVLCTNTMHLVADGIEAAAGIPLLHIADPTGAALVAAGHRTVGLLGTRFTMERDFYRLRLEQRFGLEVVVPGNDDRDTVHRVIYEELVHGVVTDASRAEYRAVIDRLVRAGADSVILGCTEITLLVGADDSPVPVFDTTALHARAAVDAALAG